MLQLDFDGTLTKNNVGLEIMQHFTTSKESLDTISQAYSKGEISIEQCIEEAWRLVDAPPNAIKHYAMHFSQFRGNIIHFQHSLIEANIPFVITSFGHPAYILPFLAQSYSLITPHFILDNKRWKVFLPTNMKTHVVHNLNTTIYVGDSLSDWNAALAVHKKGGKVFAPKDSILSKTTLFCSEQFNPHNVATYDTLEELLDLVLHYGQ